MKVRIDYTVDITEQFRRSLDYHYARIAVDPHLIERMQDPYTSKLASRDDVVEFLKHSGTDRIPSVLMAYTIAVKNGEVVEQQKQKRCASCRALWLPSYLEDGKCPECRS